MLKVQNLSVNCVESGTYLNILTVMGSVSLKPRKVFGPAKPFLDNLYVKTERCIYA